MSALGFAVGVVIGLVIWALIWAGVGLGYWLLDHLDPARPSDPGCREADEEQP